MHPEISALLQKQPIYVTGWGGICAAGRGGGALWEAAIANQGTAQERDGLVACRVDRVESESLPRRLRAMDPIAQLALLAARDALVSAGLDGGDGQGLGVIGASSRGPITIWEQGAAAGEKGARIAPSFAVNSTVASLSGIIAQEVGAEGMSMTVSATCSSSAHAIALGAEQILLGKLDRVLVGGADCGSHPLVHQQMSAAGTVGEHADPRLTCRPFDAARSGLVPGDGAGFLVLESARSVEARSASTKAELAGWATVTSQAGRAGVEPQGESLIRVMREAMAVSNADPEEIATINAHGTGTRANDASEAQAYRSFLGDSHPAAISSTKPVTGHCLGATPALEAILAIQSLAEGIAPPIVGLTNPDPVTCGLSLAMNHPVPLSDGDLAMSNASGFWGTLSSLIFRSP